MAQKTVTVLTEQEIRAGRELREAALLASVQAARARRLYPSTPAECVQLWRNVARELRNQSATPGRQRGVWSEMRARASALEMCAETLEGVL